MNTYAALDEGETSTPPPGWNGNSKKPNLIHLDPNANDYQQKLQELLDQQLRIERLKEDVYCKQPRDYGMVSYKYSAVKPEPRHFAVSNHDNDVKSNHDVLDHGMVSYKSSAVKPEPRHFAVSNHDNDIESKHDVFGIFHGANPSGAVELPYLERVKIMGNKPSAPFPPPPNSILFQKLAYSMDPNKSAFWKNYASNVGIICAVAPLQNGGAFMRIQKRGYGTIPRGDLIYKGLYVVGYMHASYIDMGIRGLKYHGILSRLPDRSKGTKCCRFGKIQTSLPLDSAVIFYIRSDRGFGKNSADDAKNSLGIREILDPKSHGKWEKRLVCEARDQHGRFIDCGKPRYAEFLRGKAYGN